MNKHDTIIYGIVGIIICVQLFFFLKNFKKIMAYKTIIASNEKLSVIELSIDEDQVATLDPEYLLENKRFYENQKIQDSQDYSIDDELKESHNLKYDDTIEFNEQSEEFNESDDDNDEDSNVL